MRKINSLLNRAAREFASYGAVFIDTQALLEDAGFDLTTLDAEVERRLAA